MVRLFKISDSCATLSTKTGIVDGHLLVHIVLTFLRSAGVETIDCDIPDQKVKVTGDVEPSDVLRRCKKCFRKSVLV
jgi:hypothetical protein